MANLNAPNGLTPTKVLGGGSPTLTGKYTIASGYANNIYRGMPVKRTGTGNNVIPSAAGDADNIGVFYGVSYTDINGKHSFAKAWRGGTVGTEINAHVHDAPNLIFEVQCDTLNEADVGLLADLNGVTGDLVTGNSTAVLAASTGATTGRSFHILRKIDRPGNDYGPHCRAEVCWAEHSLKTGAAGAGGV
jgi:hypothetical protein